MIAKEIEQRLNDQMNFEMYSANIYLGMAAYLESLNLGGFANWMKIQYQEEMVHCMKFYDYLNERGGRAVFGAMDAPPEEWDSPLAAFENALEHERVVTGRINDLVARAAEAKDHATFNFLQWFVAEQVEEEAGVEDIIQKLKMVDGAPGGMFVLDRELGARTLEGGEE